MLVTAVKSMILTWPLILKRCHKHIMFLFFFLVDQYFICGYIRVSILRLGYVEQYLEIYHVEKILLFENKYLEKILIQYLYETYFKLIVLISFWCEWITKIVTIDIYFQFFLKQISNALKIRRMRFINCLYLCNSILSFRCLRF